MSSPHVISTAPVGSFVAQPQGGRAYARSLSTLARPAPVVSRQSLPVRPGDALSQTQQRSRRPVASSHIATSQRWMSPEPQQQPHSVKVMGARPPAGTPAHRMMAAGSGFATVGGITGGTGPDDNELSRTWRGQRMAAAHTPIAPLPPRDKAASFDALGPSKAAPSQNHSEPFAEGQPALYYSDNQKDWFDCTVIGPDSAGGIQVNINGHDRIVPPDKLATHLKAVTGNEMPNNALDEVPPSMSGTWRSRSQELDAPAVPTMRQPPQGVEAQDPRLVRRFVPPNRTTRCPSASPERSLTATRIIGQQLHQSLQGRPFTAIMPVCNHTAGREARSPVPSIKTGSFVAERPVAQDTRQTASFTAIPMYKWGESAATRPAALRMRAVSGSYTQTGHKMRAPGCPNQDCHLVVPLSAGVLLAAVFDGHGAHGHLVSQFVRGVFERFANSLALLPESELAEGFAKVFNLAQESLEREGLAEMAGTTATVALVNANAGILTVAHVGDSTLAVYVGKHVSFKTKDHVVDAEAEVFVRAQGGDVRSSTFDGVTAKRIYHKGEDSAGLGMSRALGHTELVPLIVNAPEVAIAQFSPGSMIVIASDGIWEKIPPEALAEIVAAQPPTMTNTQAGSLARTLVAEGRKRWHGDIDDITAVVVRAVPDVNGGSLSAPANS